MFIPDWAKEEKEPNQTFVDQDQNPHAPEPPKHSLQDQYKAASSDVDVSRAQEEADRNNLTTNLLRSLSQIAAAPSVARGGKGVDNSLYDSLIKGNNDRVARAEQARKDRTDSLLMQDKLGQQEKERDFQGKVQAHQEGQWAIAADRAPGGKTAKSMMVYARAKGIKLPAEAENLSTDDLWNIIKEEEKAKSSNSDDGFLDKFSIRNADNTESRWGVKKDGTKVLLGSGVTASQSSQNAKLGTAAKEAEAAYQTKDKLVDGILKQYDEAAKEGLFGSVGPLGGRIADVKERIGLSTGPASDDLRTKLDMDVVDYLRRVSGAQATNEEYARIRSLMARPTQTKAALEHKLKTAVDYAHKVANEKRAAAGLPALGASVGPTPPKQSPQDFPRTVRKSDGTTATVSNEKEMEEAKQEGFE
jgi:hypothetical protein